MTKRKNVKVNGGKVHLWATVSSPPELTDFIEDCPCGTWVSSENAVLTDAPVTCKRCLHILKLYHPKQSP